MPFVTFDATPEIRCEGWLVNGALFLNRREIIEAVTVDDLLAGTVRIIEGTFEGEFHAGDDWESCGHYGVLWTDEGQAYFIRAGYLDVPERPVEEAI